MIWEDESGIQDMQIARVNIWEISIIGSLFDVLIYMV